MKKQVEYEGLINPSFTIVNDTLIITEHNGSPVAESKTKIINVADIKNIKINLTFDE